MLSRTKVKKISLRILVFRPVLHLLRNRFSTHFDFSLFLQFDFHFENYVVCLVFELRTTSRTILRTTLRSLRKPLRVGELVV